MAKISQIMVEIAATGAAKTIQEIQKTQRAQEEAALKAAKAAADAKKAAEAQRGALSKLGSEFGSVGTILSGFGGNVGRVGNAISGLGGKMEMLGDGAEGAGAGAEGAAAGLSKFGMAALAIGATVGVAIAAYKGFEKVVQMARIGADIEYTKSKFDNLARSIGTTGDALLIDLRKATRGTVSDLELTSNALDMMTLGLTKSHTDTVRLATVAGALGWNMNQLTLTISNLSMMRLDSLGLSVAAVKPRFEELKAAGVDAQQAMTIALIEAGEAVVKLQGHVADSAKGGWAQLDATTANIKDNLNELASIRFGGLATGLNDVASAFNEMVKNSLDTEKAYQLFKKFHELGGDVRDESGLAGWLPNPPTGLYRDANGELVKYAENLDEVKRKVIEFYSQNPTQMAIQQHFVQLATATENYRSALEGSTVTTDVLSQRIGQAAPMFDMLARSVALGIIPASDLAGEHKRLVSELGKTGGTAEAVSEAFKTKYKNSMAQYLRGVQELTPEMRALAIEFGLIKANSEDVGRALKMEAVAGMQEFADEMVKQQAHIQSLSMNWGNMSKMVLEYDKQLGNVATANARIKELEPFEHTGGMIDGAWKSAKNIKKELEELRGVVEQAEEAMEQFANKMTLDMMASTFSIGGYTQAEIDTLTDYMVASGMITQEAADRMKESYAEAIRKVNEQQLKTKVAEFEAKYGKFLSDFELVDGKMINKKTGEVDLDLTAFWDSLSDAEKAELKPLVAKVVVDDGEAKNYTPPMDKKLLVSIQLDTSAIDGYNPPTRYGNVIYLPNRPQEQALGGPVWGGSPYLVGERGPELFVPNTAGTIVPDWKVNASANLDHNALAAAITTGSANMDYGQLETAVESAFNRALDRYDNKLRPTAVMSRASAFENTERWR